MFFLDYNIVEWNHRQEVDMSENKASKIIRNNSKTILADDIYSFGEGVVVGGGFDPRCPVMCYFCQRVFGGEECAMTPKNGGKLCLMLANGEIVENVEIKKCMLMSDEAEQAFDVEMQITCKGDDRQLMASEMFGFGWYREELQCQKRVDH